MVKIYRQVVQVTCTKLWIKAAITKTCLYNFDPLKPHIYTVKLGFTWVCIIFLISAQKQRLWVLVRTASQYQTFVSEKILVSGGKIFYIYSNRRIFVMKGIGSEYLEQLRYIWIPQSSKRLYDITNQHLYATSDDCLRSWALDNIRVCHCSGSTL